MTPDGDAARVSLGWTHADEDVQFSPHWIAVGAGGFLVLIFVKQLDSVPPSPLKTLECCGISQDVA